MIKPSEGNERIDAIDIVRGFALFGIFLVNMPAFFLPFLYIDQHKAAETVLDSYVVIFIDIFAQANFYTLFSFLFGFGTILFYERLKEKELRPLSYLLRRFLFLLAIGLVHAFLIWHGDILITYSIVAFLLLFYLTAKSKTLLTTAVTLIVLPYLLFLLAVSQSDGGTTGSGNGKPAERPDLVEIYQQGTYVDITLQRIEDWLYVHGGLGLFLVSLMLLPMFLIGAYFAKEKLFHEASKNHTKLKKIAIITLSFGLILKLSPYLTENRLIATLQDYVGGPLMAIGYATAIVLLVNLKKGLKILAPLRYVGRMSLSNYILQSIICTMIFYSYGLGLYGNITNKTGLLLTIVIFIGQILFSKWWLTGYRYGPLEWLWRIVTYQKKLTVRKNEQDLNKSTNI